MAFPLKNSKAVLLIEKVSHIKKEVTVNDYSADAVRIQATKPANKLIDYRVKT